jgi:hypothetical protein
MYECMEHMKYYLLYLAGMVGNRSSSQQPNNTQTQT